MSAPYTDDTGFHELGMQGWTDNLTALWSSIYGADKNFSADTPDGQLIIGLAARFARMEQLTHQVYDSRSSSGAIGVALSRLVQLHGISRKSAGCSTAPATLFGVAGTVIPQGSLVGSNSDRNKPAFAVTSDVTIGTGGTAPTTLQCTVSGPIQAAAGDLTSVLSVVTGWTGVTNTESATPGINFEADPMLRLRRARSLAFTSQGLLDGLEAGLLNLRGVADARVYENVTGVTDLNGLPPHAIKAVVRGGVAAEIAAVMFLKAGMGVTQVGAQSFSVSDANGNPQTMQWDVAADVDAYVVIQLDRPTTTSTLLYMSDQMGKAIAQFFSPDGDFPPLIGQNVPWQNLATPINRLGLTGRPGQPTVAAVYLGRNANPTTQADLVVHYNEIAVFEPSRVAVVGR